MTATPEEHGWTIHAEAVLGRSVPDRKLDALIDAFVDVSGSLTTGKRRVGATFSLRDPKLSAAEAAAAGAAAFLNRLSDQGIVGTVVRLEALTFAEHDAELAEPAFPELVGVTEIGELFGFTRQRASQLAARSDFPVPVCTLRSGPVWIRANVEGFLGSDWRRKGGRPKKVVDALAQA